MKGETQRVTAILITADDDLHTKSLNIGDKSDLH